jgi:hypothetical protein
MHASALPPMGPNKLPKLKNFGNKTHSINTELHPSHRDVNALLNSKNAKLLSSTVDPDAEFLYNENTQKIRRPPIS